MDIWNKKKKAKYLEIEKLYYDLIYAVERKSLLQTRHETAKSYIVEAERKPMESLLTTNLLGSSK